ncbi:MAG: winged helix-turn-helix domain-containing protein, partial [Proteobacteria bacterium]|nr:winged helix-turn-helix domain-containing protein [Pseudomonadota bacterium]
MRPHGTPKALEKRRRKAIRLLKSGKTFRWVAAELGASLSSVVRWSQDHRKHGLAALRPKIIPGRSPFLSSRQKSKLIDILLHGPLRLGYQTNLWTLGRVGEVIEAHFGIRYSISNLWKLMYLLGWSCQTPDQHARELNEKAVRHWKRYRWLHLITIKKT